MLYEDRNQPSSNSEQFEGEGNQPLGNSEGFDAISGSRPFPDYSSMLEAWNNGTFDIARRDEKNESLEELLYKINNPQEEKIIWSSGKKVEEKPKTPPSLYDRFIKPGVDWYKNYNKGYYKEGEKIPEELK